MSKKYRWNTYLTAVTAVDMYIPRKSRVPTPSSSESGSDNEGENEPLHLKPEYFPAVQNQQVIVEEPTNVNTLPDLKVIAETAHGDNSDGL